MSDLFWTARTISNAVEAGMEHNVTGSLASTPQVHDVNNAEINERLEQLLLVSAAMWELLRERTSLTENDLVAKIAEIDARDGTADGRITATPRKCAKCQRVIIPKHRRCLYCGHQVTFDSVFKSV